MASVLNLVKHYQHIIEKYSNDEQKVLKCIDKLFQLEVTVQHLQETGVGRTVNALRKEPGDVGQAARSLVYKWKLMVAAEESDQEGDHNETAAYNGHEKDSDDNAKQSRSKDYSDKCDKSSSSPRIKKDKESKTNGDYGNKRKYQSSEEEESEIKRSKHSSSSENEDSKKKIIKVKKEESESESESDSEDSRSDDSDSYDSESSREAVKIKKEPSDKHRSSSSSKHSTSHSNHTDHKKESSSNKSHASSSDKHSHSSKSKDRHSSEKSSSKDKSDGSHKHKNSKEKDEVPKEKHKPEHKSSESEKKPKETKHSSKHNSDQSKTSSNKTDNNLDKHRHSSEKSSSKSEKHKSSRAHSSDKEKHKSSSEKEISSHKHKSRENCLSSSSKDRHSSSSKDKSKDKSSSSKDKSSTHSEKKHVSSSEHKSGSHSKTQPERKSGDKKEKEKAEDGREKKSKDKSSSSSHKSSKSKEVSTSKSKDEVPKKKAKSNSEDSEDGIDCGSGASFAEALGMISPTKPKKKSALKEISSPNNMFNNLSPAALLAPTAQLTPLPTLEISALPEISPNYKPRPPPKLLNHLSDEDAMSVVISSKNQRTKVYSGNKVIGGKITSLYEMCVHVLQEHIDALEYTGGVPYEILKPVVDRATPQQLFLLEHYNPYLMEETDHLWQTFCERHFRNKPRQEMETWREMYMRCQEEQEHRLKSLTANIKMTQEAKKAPIKQTKMAYVDNFVKPPRNIARKQAQHGTAHAAASSPASRVASLGVAPNVLRAGRPLAPPASSSLKPKKAPLMQKALQFMRGRKR